MDLSMVIAAQVVSNKRHTGRVRSVEDEFYENYGFDYFANVKSVLRKFRTAANSMSAIMNRGDVLVERDA